MVTPDYYLRVVAESALAAHRVVQLPDERTVDYAQHQLLVHRQT